MVCYNSWKQQHLTWRGLHLFASLYFARSSAPAQAYRARSSHASTNIHTRQPSPASPASPAQPSPAVSYLYLCKGNLFLEISSGPAVLRPVAEGDRGTQVNLATI